MGRSFSIFKYDEDEKMVYYEYWTDPIHKFFTSIEKHTGRIKFFSTKNFENPLLVHELSTEHVPLNCPDNLNLYDVRFVAFQLYKAWKAQEFPDSLSKFS